MVGSVNRWAVASWRFGTQGDGVDDNKIPLADFIAALREELEKARRQGAKQGLRFGVGPIEFELETVATREATAKAGVRFWVVEAGGEGTVASGTTTRLKLTLSPVGVLQVGDDTVDPDKTD
jgi:hypothetical protein